MRILIADDDPVGLRALQRVMEKSGHEVVTAGDGDEAWQRIEETPFDIVVSDWMMPGVDGPELCRRIRLRDQHPFCFVILLTARDTDADLVEGIMAGADDFITKPWVRDVLQARLHAAERVVRLERDLAQKVADLEQALDEVKTLRGLLPICMYCKSIQDGPEAWARIEAYISQHSEAEFSHSICPGCYESQVKPMLDEMRDRRKAG